MYLYDLCMVKLSVMWYTDIGGDIMALTEAKRKANNKYIAANMTVLGCKVRKDKAERFKTACKLAGTTPNAIFTAAMDSFLSEHDKDAPAAEEEL